MKLLSRTENERGIALVVALMATLIIVGLMAGAFAAINADQRLGSIDRDQTQVYAAAHAGLEKLTSDLAALFINNVSPTADQLNYLTENPPPLPGFHFIAPGDTPVVDEVATSGYQITWNGASPTPIENATIQSGPYQGLMGMITQYYITVTARSAAGGAEVRLKRELNTVAVPVFQFGVFSERNLTFYAGDDFDFGGRVHTNGSLFLAELTGQTMTFRDKITAVGNVIRSHMSNDAVSTGVFGSPGGVVRIIKVFPSTFAEMKLADDSVTGSPGAWTLNTNEGSVTGQKGWSNISNIKFNGNVKNGLTGATALNLPLVDPSVGAEPIDLIRRAEPNEDTVKPALFDERLFKKASLRILLSDRDADITNLPTVSTGAPVPLSGDWVGGPPTGYTVDATHPPIALSPGPILNVTGSTSTYAGGLAQIYLANGINIAVGFKIPAAGLTVQSALGTFTAIQCKGKTASSFTNCDLTLKPIGTDGVVTVTMPSGVTISAPMTAVAVAAGVNKTINLSTATTALPTQPFSLSTFSVNGTLVQCEGYDTNPNPQAFTNCRGLTAAPGNNLNISTHALSTAEQPLIGGVIKVERKLANGTWTDVTMEILNLGIGAPNQDGFACGDPTTTAILRLQRLRDNAGNAATACHYFQSRHYYDWWPNVLYDAREANFRDVTSTLAPLEMGGLMHYVALDVNNLKRWLNNEFGGTGNQVLRENAGTGGYIVYFSDHRGDHRDGVAGDPETGEYGYEDTLNRNSTNGVPNTSLDLGEDVNGNAVHDLYGGTPWASALPAGNVAPYNNTATHTSNVIPAEARLNKAVLFRRALKLVNGGINSAVNSLPAAGLTIATDNPVYIQGNYNANASPNTSPDDNTTQPNVPAAVFADAVTLLSNSWKDTASFRTPHDRSSRNATTTGYRVAIIAGTSLSFPLSGTSYPSGTSGLFGTDGGIGNFLRLVEDWSGQSINYRGSIVSLFNSRQATGTFKYGPNVYVYSTRNFKFDLDFKQPALLPPGTPMFRDLNTLNFRQILRPNQ